MTNRNEAHRTDRFLRIAKPVVGVALGLLAVSTPQAAQAAAPWITAYLPAWEVVQNGVSPSGIDYNSITHLVWFSLVPTSTGTIVEASNNTGVNANASAVESAVHGAGKKVLISIGGANSEPGFQAAFNSGNTSTLVSNIVSWVNTNNFDGVDIDDEPMASGDIAQYQTFITSLRTALGASKTITIAAEPYGAATSAFSSLTSSVNQVNIMSYDMIFGNGLASGTGEMTWYNAPISNGGNFEQTGPPMPSITSTVTNFEGASVASTKLGIGAAFYGYIFPGTTGPMQAYTGTWPVNALSYNDIMTNSAYYNASYYHYDSASGAAYIGRTDTGNFITYDDSTAIAAKLAYIRNNSLGGMVCFEIGQQYMSGTNPLLHAIDNALHGTITAGNHTLTPQNATGSRLDNAGGCLSNGNKIQIWSTNGSTNQLWTMSMSGVYPTGDWNLAAYTGPYCLDAAGGAIGTATQLWSCNGHSSQSWMSLLNPNGTYTFMSFANTTCLDVAGAGTSNGTVVQSATCNGSTAQQWAVN